MWVEEPSRDEAVEILRGLRARCEKHHGVEISLLLGKSKKRVEKLRGQLRLLDWRKGDLPVKLSHAFLQGLLGGVPKNV